MTLGVVRNNDLPKVSGDTGLPWYRCEKGGRRSRRWQCKAKPPCEFGGDNLSDLTFPHL